ncbi:hypothetical protein STEG23_003797, partial [Scotinomys teguina]
SPYEETHINANSVIAHGVAYKTSTHSCEFRARQDIGYEERKGQNCSVNHVAIEHLHKIILNGDVLVIQWLQPYLKMSMGDLEPVEKRLIGAIEHCYRGDVLDLSGNQVGVQYCDDKMQYYDVTVQYFDATKQYYDITVEYCEYTMQYYEITVLFGDVIM